MKSKHPKTEFVLASIVAMFALHGNTKQFWPKIPYLSLRDESVGEHTRLIFNSFTLVTLIQLLLGRLPRERALPRAGAIGVATAALPVLIGLNLRRLKLRAAVRGLQLRASAAAAAGRRAARAVSDSINR